VTARERAESVLAEWVIAGGHPPSAMRILAAAGVLDDLAARRWERRLARAGRPDAPLAPAAGARLRAALDRVGPDDRRGALNLALALGALEPHEAGDRLAAVEGDATPALPRTTYASAAHPDGPGRLRAVLAGPAERRGGVRITSIAVRERGTEIRWHRDGLTPAREWGETAERSHVLRPQMELLDDVGTDYRPARAGASGNRVAARGTIELGPAVPPHARRLTLLWGGGASSCDAVGS
jgi:hypothetical protein